MREADIALYEAKAAGRGCDVRFEAAMGQKIEKRRMLEVDLRNAIAQGELSRPLPADRRGLDRPDQLGRGAVPLDQPAPWLRCRPTSSSRSPRKPA